MVSAKVRERNRSSGIIGLRTWRSATTNNDERQEADDERPENDGVIGPEGRPLEKAENEAAQSQHGQRRSEPVDTIGSGRVMTLCHEGE